MPMRVWLSQSHRNTPTTIARPSMKSRLVAYRSPAISKKWVTAPGHTTRSASPPKWASIWSARITDTAIVISAWRRSSPWFQRRRSWWMTTPARAAIDAPASSGTIQSNRPTSEASMLRDLPTIDCWSSIATYAESRNSEPCTMLTVRIRPKTSVNPDATTNSSPAKVSPSSRVTMNSPGSSIAAPADVPRAKTSTHRSTNPPTTTAAHVAGASARHHARELLSDAAGTRLDQRFSHSPQSPRRHGEVPPRPGYGRPARVGRRRGAIGTDASEGARTD